MNSTLPSGDFPMTSFVPPPLPGALITHSTAKPALLGAMCGEAWLVSEGGSDGTAVLRWNRLRQDSNPSVVTMMAEKGRHFNIFAPLSIIKGTSVAGSCSTEVARRRTSPAPHD